MSGLLNFALLDSSLPAKVAGSFDEGLRQKRAAALDQMEYDKSMQAVEDDKWLRENARTTNGDISKLAQLAMGSGRSKIGMDLQSKLLEQQGKQATINKDTATAGKTNFEITKERVAWLQNSMAGLINNPTYENGVSTINNGLAMGMITPEMRDRALSELQQDPTNVKAFATRKNAEMMSAMERMNFSNPKPVEVKLGNRVAFVDQNPNSASFGKEVQSLAMGQSPDSAASVGATIRGQNMADARSRESNMMTREANANIYDAERGVLINKATGVARPAMSGDGSALAPKEKPLTDGQSKAALFGARMEAANNILGQLAADGTTTSVPGMNAGYGVGAAMNIVASPNQQKLMQAKRDFINATLRRESGAVISSEEFDNGGKQYFPQAGDAVSTIAQKANNRAIAIRGVQAEVPAANRGTIKNIVGSSQPTISNWNK